MLLGHHLFNRHHLISVLCFYLGSNKSTRKGHENVARTSPIKRPFVLCVCSGGSWELTAGKETPCGLVQIHAHAHISHADAGEKSHEHKFIVQTDHLHIQLGERGNQKIQLLHLRYPKLLFPPRLIRRLRITLTIDAIQYSACASDSCIICICNFLLEFQVGFFFKVCPFFPQVRKCTKLRYFLRKKKCHKKYAVITSITELWTIYFGKCKMVIIGLQLCQYGQRSWATPKWCQQFSGHLQEVHVIHCPPWWKPSS